ncbi:MAG: CoB--CoM heterodisulfide reductase iron-sulfur subunit A family protein [Candidatus Eisenbacteria bacterium]|nr:CoB--CoM heterodisulfide reductase iron-sulfur subunit A family protein [Candidatus Eisenbacteria bacterium]
MTEKKSTVLIYGTNLGGYRAAYALCKKGYKTIQLNRGSYVDEYQNQALTQLPFDFGWICGHMPQRLFKGLGCLTDHYNAELLEVSGKAGNFRVKFKKKDQVVNNFACIECGRCVEVCPVTVGDRKAMWVNPKVGWENIYLVDWENCTRCGKCEEVCPTGALKLDRPEETLEADVGAIILAPEFEGPDASDLSLFAYGRSPSVILNSETARRSLLTNFTEDSVRLPSGKLPESFAVVVTPHFNKPGVEYENYNLSVTAVDRAIRIRTTLPSSKVTVFLKDYRGFGKNHYRWYQRALELGVNVVRTDKLSVHPESGEKATVKYGSDGGAVGVELVILVTGQKSPSQMKRLSEVCGVKPDSRGFCHIRRHSSVETDVDGILAVGEFSGPKGNPETIWEGCASLTEAIKYLGKPEFTPPAPPPLTSRKGEEIKVGVFICSCFDTFRDKMDLELLRTRTQELYNVDHAEIVRGCCTPPTMKETAERIKASGVNRVVLAACTPLQKLLKYRNTMMMAGLNPLLAEFVRLREDVIYTHHERDKMLEKGLSVIRAGVARVRLGFEAPTPKDKFLSETLVIGGGLAGLSCATELAANGFKVTLVERRETLGGNLAYLEGDQREYVDSLIEKAQASSLITVFTKSTVENMTGYAGNFDVGIETPRGRVAVGAGVIMIATGAGEYETTGFLRGADPRVVTQAELPSRMEKSQGLKHVVMIQCVGSRNQEHRYCSRVCCNQALAHAVELRKKGSEVTVLYRDMTAYGEDNLYEKAVELGVQFVRFPDDDYPRVKAGDGRLQVTVNDAGREKTLNADLVALSTGIVPDMRTNEAISRVLGYPIDADGFFDSDANGYPYEEAIKRLTKPFELASNCIFPVGLAHSPRSFDETLLTCRDMVGRALVLLGKGAFMPPNSMYVAEVKEDFCVGCGLCVDVCPYSARVIDPIKRVAVVRPFLCDSCGSCVAICPNDASSLRDFTGKQSIAVLDATLA